MKKQQAIERGPILEINVRGIMRLKMEEYPQTYSFDGGPAYYSLSAFIPDWEEENPHAHMRFVFEEDTGWMENGNHMKS